MKHQELRDAIRNLMKENDERLDSIRRQGELISNLDSGVSSELVHQNEKLQAILGAHN
jgi:hypothetical protein